jgi:transposase
MNRVSRAHKCTTSPEAVFGMTKPTKHTESQIAEILREARKSSINEVATKYSVSEAAIYAWHSKFGKLGAEEIKRLRHLKLDHARRKRYAL